MHSPELARRGVLFLLASILFHIMAGSIVPDTAIAGSPPLSLATPLDSGGTPIPDSQNIPPYLDLDRGIVRSVNIEESWVENAFYIHSVSASDLSAGNNWVLSGELDFALNSWFGGELDFPVLLMTYPLGSGPSTLGPIDFGLRFVPYQNGSDVSRTAAILSFEIEGNWWPTPEIQSFRGQGNSVTPELLWAFRYHRVYLQGNTGYTVPVGPGAIANPFFQISVGRTWKHLWAFQIESDWNGALPTPNGQIAYGVTVIPEIAYTPFGDLWLNEVGEGVSSMGNFGPQPTTYFMTEYEFHGL